MGWCYGIGKGQVEPEEMCPKERAEISVWSCQCKLAGESKEGFLFLKQDVMNRE